MAEYNTILSNHKYLQELNLSKDNLWMYDDSQYPDDKRIPVWEKEREEYGFDSRETWDLRFAFYLWLYERLRMYLDRSSKIINLDYYTFEHKGKEYTQRTLVEDILQHIRFFFSEEFNDGNLEHCNYVREIEELWMLLTPVMWW